MLEEDLLLSPDFMPFMALCLDTVDRDTSLAGAQAWNINGEILMIYPYPRESTVTH